MGYGPWHVRVAGKKRQSSPGNFCAVCQRLRNSWHAPTQEEAERRNRAKLHPYDIQNERDEHRTGV